RSRGKTWRLHGVLAKWPCGKPNVPGVKQRKCATRWRTPTLRPCQLRGERMRLPMWINRTKIDHHGDHGPALRRCKRSGAWETYAGARTALRGGNVRIQDSSSESGQVKLSPRFAGAGERRNRVLYGPTAHPSE